MSIGRTIRQLRNKAHLKQADIAEAVGVDQSAISHWENDKYVPDLDKIPRLAKFFHVPVQTFFDESTDSLQTEAEAAPLQTREAPTPYTENLKDALVQATSLERLQVYASQAYSVPLVTLGRVHASIFEDEEPVGRSVEVTATFLSEHPVAQAVVVEGNCLNRVAPEGSIAIFDPDVEPGDGRIAIIETANHHIIMRRWFKGSSTLMLKADSFQHYDDIVITDDEPIRVIGTVVRVIVPDDLL